MNDVSNAEELVRKLDKLRAEEDKYETYRRQIRLGRGVEMTRLRLRSGVFGFGWSVADEVTPMPSGMEHEFYEFLSHKQSKVGSKIAEVKKALAS